MELDPPGGVGEGYREALVPNGILGVGSDARAGDDGAGEANLDVGVAGDDFMAVLRLVLETAAIPGGVYGNATRDEAAAEVLGDHVHVGEAAGLDNPEVEITMERRQRRRIRGGLLWLASSALLMEWYCGLLHPER